MRSTSYLIFSSCKASLAISAPTSCPKFVAQAAYDRIAAMGTKTAYIEPSSPSENGYIESLNAHLRDELLDREVLYMLREDRIVI